MQAFSRAITLLLLLLTSIFVIGNLVQSNRIYRAAQTSMKSPWLEKYCYMTYNQLFEWNGENATKFMTWNITNIQGDLIDLHLISHGINVTDGNVTFTTDAANLTIGASTREVINCSDPYYIGEKWPFWIETNVTFGSVINIWYGTNVISRDERISIFGKLRDCWVVEYNWATATMKRWYDKISGIVLKIHVFMHHQNITTETIETAIHTNRAQYFGIHNLDSGLSYLSIQEAIDANETLDGHTILVDAGTYYEHIVVDKALTLIGAGAGTTTINGNESVSSSRGVVTIRANGVQIEGFRIRLSGGDSHWRFSGGIFLDSDNNTIIRNTISNNNYGIILSDSQNNIISENKILSNKQDGIYSGINNMIIGNTISKNLHGVWFEGEWINNNTVYNNNITENNIGILITGWILLGGSITNPFSRTSYAYHMNHTIEANRISKNGIGISLDCSCSNKIIGNTISNNDLGVKVLGDAITHSDNNSLYYNNFINNIVQVSNNGNNTWDNGYPSGGNYWSDYNGTDLFINEPGIKPGDWIEYDLNWTDPPAPPYTVWIRREILAVNGSIITVETVQERSDGSFKNDTEKGDVVEDTVAGAMGIWLIPSGLQTGDLINITGFGVVSINGTDQRAYLGSEHTVVWCDFLRMGFDVIVFWDQETGVVLEMHTQHVTRQGTTMINNTNIWTSGNDGIGDSPHVIDTNNADNYPLMGMFSSFNATPEHQVQTICNSTISHFRFDGAAISFNVTSEEGTNGFCRILVPTALMNKTYRVLVNGAEVSHDLLPPSNSTHSYLYFTYNHSTQEVTIIPEFQSLFILPLFIIAALTATTFYRKRTK